MDINRTPKNYTELGNGIIEGRTLDLTSAMMTMREMFRADHRFAGQWLNRFVTVIVTTGVVFDIDRLERETQLLISEGVDVICIGKGISG